MRWSVTPIAATSSAASRPTPLTEIPAYFLVNARLGAKIADQYDLSFWVDNLFDKTYFQSSGTASIVGLGLRDLGAPGHAAADLRRDPAGDVLGKRPQLYFF